jgi:aspartate carbamoyltransferase catalytic subunit
MVKDFAGQHLLSVQGLSREAVETVFSVADLMVPFAERRMVTRVLEGAILGNMFFEPSTRTRVSFGCAFNLLGGEVRETIGVESSSLAKGESLEDTARVLSGYSDVIVMRHPEGGAVDRFASASRVPVLNGGDGAREHPTQALLDLYTIRRERAALGLGLDGLRIALMGDLRYGRAVHSLVQILALYPAIEFHLISPPELALPEAYEDALRAGGHQVHRHHALASGLQAADIVYVTRTQEERFPSPEEAARYRGLFRLNQEIYTAHCAPNTVIMHPLPRDSRAGAQELDADLDAHPALAIFRQADNGVLIRMALFALCLDVVGALEKDVRPVRWYTGGRR